MGTRYEDQPPEHWAGPESLDPTPVWRQFLVFGLLALTALGVIGVVSFFALQPMFVTPPAIVSGGRLVLLRSQVQDPTGAPVRVLVESGSVLIEPWGPYAETLPITVPLEPGQRAFWLFRRADHEYTAVDVQWTHPDTSETCSIGPTLGHPRARTDPPAPAFVAGPQCGRPQLTFTYRGDPITAPRGLDRYLVSVSGDRVIVNISREIRGAGATSQPLVSPLATPVQTRRP